jgi:hypothetical protein
MAVRISSQIDSVASPTSFPGVHKYANLLDSSGCDRRNGQCDFRSLNSSVLEFNFSLCAFGICIVSVYVKQFAWSLERNFHFSSDFLVQLPVWEFYITVMAYQ